MIKNLFYYAIKTRYLHFFLTGVTGVLLNTIVTFVFAEFIFTNPQYKLLELSIKNTTLSIIIGQSVSLLYIFILHTSLTFQTKKYHKRRLVIFILYSLFITYIVVLPIILYIRNILEFTLPNLLFLKFLIGLEYILASIITIAIFSFINFFIMKLWIFREE